GALMGARGNSGVILSQILRGFTMALQNNEEINAEDVANALQKGVEIAYKSVLKPVEGTILTVSRKAAEAAVAAIGTETTIDGMLRIAAEAGKIALDHTPEQLPVLKEAGVVDAGGRGFLYILEGGLAALLGETIVTEAPADDLVVKDKTVAFSAEFQEADIKFGYCTELMIHNATKDHEYVREHITKEVEGDSLVCVGDEGIIKVHYHSNAPGKIITFAQTIGELFDIKVENMKEQMAREAAEKRAMEYRGSEADEEVSAPAKAEGPKKKCAVVAVSSGEGISEIFKGLGVDAVISGGQTLNPSAEDILNAIESVNAEEYVILPNNSNIIFAARQVVELCEAPVYVVPSKFMTQGLAALMEYNPEAGGEENAEAMTDILGDIQNGELTFAVRDTTTDGIEIKADDILVLLNGKIVSADKSVEEGLFSLLENMDTEDASLLTLYYGSDVTEEDAEALVAKIEEQYEDLEVELYSGGQPLYYYLISLE
ncbi:MAG: DAK2 domain-containing protein, partial [Firmicutes bacterium]|nr:DAK2 domain-containing protein [Bacillota bacterium]